MFFANPTSPDIRAAMRAGRLGFIDTPAQGNRRPDGVTWCADNGAFSDKFDEGKWWRFLVKHAPHASSCAFAALPDVVGNWSATLTRSLPWIDRVRDLGYPVAVVLQNGATVDTVPWDRIDAVFVGGDDDFKLGPAARDLVAEAKRRGLWAHMGRVNSEKRLRYAHHIGCDSTDGTVLVFDQRRLPKVLGWLRGVNDQPALFGGAA